MAGATGNNETSIGSCYTVVYDFDDDKRSWKVSGEGGWSELHICKDQSETPCTYRILAWTHENQEVLVNVNLNHKCEYKEKSENFHSFKDEHHIRRGFGFHKSERNLQSAKDYLSTVLQTLTELRRHQHTTNPTGARNPSIISTVPTISDNASGRARPPERQPDGTLRIHDPCQAKSVLGDLSIHNPEVVQHKVHVEFDPETGQYTYSGDTGVLPPGWKEHALKQFGFPPNQVPGVKLRGYESKIPSILVHMKKKLIELDGLQETGIFRLAPDAAECARIKELMNTGGEWMHQIEDVNIVANLIKVWYRELPKPILNSVKPRVIEMNQTEDSVAEAVHQFDPISRDLMLWLWDFCVEVSDHKDVNKMSIQNLGIVIGPNLFNTMSFDNPMKAMDFSGKVVTFFQKGISWRKNLKQSGES